ncbi:hypothetical protein EYF80_021529 [Liparis tanakae]|uniref:Uncharacterized protein n=1 Tax=Liparis tanakae TaxID=230148 RepID=A0A4Z2HR66_9TELE|nr:hypothetical protein EYF80_021529 [Liparis tanakae]
MQCHACLNEISRVVDDEGYAAFSPPPTRVSDLSSEDRMTLSSFNIVWSLCSLAGSKRKKDQILFQTDGMEQGRIGRDNWNGKAQKE